MEINHETFETIENDLVKFMNGKINYYHTVPNSNFFNDIDQIIRTVEMAKTIKDLNYEYLIEPLIDYDYILTALKNSI